MKPIWESYLCQIDITNVCPLDCVYCDRYIRHTRKDQGYFMTLDEVESAIDSLNGWTGHIGIMGGEPTVHPYFEKICYLLQRKYSRRKYQLFTMGGHKCEEYSKLIKETFYHVCLNPHDAYQQSICLHQPITVAIQDAVEDDNYRKDLIDNCWVQRTWCPTIGPKGAFFCEIAFALDIILDGPGGYPVELGWWKKSPKQFQDQVERYCKYCGMPIPMERELLKTEREKISAGNLKLFKEHNLPRLSDKDIILFDHKLTVEEMERAKVNWDPGNYRQDKKSDRLYGWEKRKQPRVKVK